MITRTTEQRRTLLRRDTVFSTESEFALFDARGGHWAGKKLEM